ncbi:MAG: hypothetical protein R3C61_20020 [Bacteroidia bacterium]
MKTQTQTLAWTIIMAIFLPMSFSGCIVFYKKKSIQQEDLGKIPYQSIPDWKSLVVTSQQGTRPFTIANSPSGTYYLSVKGVNENYLDITTEKVSTPYFLPESKLFLRRNIPKRFRQEFIHSTYLYLSQPLDDASVILPEDHIDSARQYSEALGLNVLLNTAIGVGTYRCYGDYSRYCMQLPASLYPFPRWHSDKTGLTLYRGNFKIARTNRFPPLYDLNRSGPNLEITVANELPEEEFINQVSLLRTNRIPNTEIAINTDDQLVVYSPRHSGFCR